MTSNQVHMATKNCLVLGLSTVRPPFYFVPDFALNQRIALNRRAKRFDTRKLFHNTSGAYQRKTLGASRRLLDHKQNGTKMDQNNIYLRSSSFRVRVTSVVRSTSPAKLHRMSYVSYMHPCIHHKGFWGGWREEGLASYFMRGSN